MPGGWYAKITVGLNLRQQHTLCTNATPSFSSSFWSKSMLIIFTWCFRLKCWFQVMTFQKMQAVYQHRNNSSTLRHEVIILSYLDLVRWNTESCFGCHFKRWTSVREPRGKYWEWSEFWKTRFTWKNWRNSDHYLKKKDNNNQFAKSKRCCMKVIAAVLQISNGYDKWVLNGNGRM